ncbi:MAG: cytochrome P450 [Myxococcota bacterium]
MLRLIQWLLAHDRLVRLATPVLGAFNPFRPEHRNDPHASWRALRSVAPVYRSRGLGCWVLTRYDDVLHVLRDRNFTTDRREAPIFKLLSRFVRRDPELRTMLERNLLTLDGVEHARLRGLVSRAFTPRRVERLRRRLQTVVDELLDRVPSDGRMDLVHDLAHPLPVTAIAELLGVPAADRARFRAWSSDLVQLVDPLQGHGGTATLKRATREIFDYFRPLLAARRAEPRDDLLSAMATAAGEGDPVGELELLGLASLLLVAGHETTANLIGNGVLALLANPGERKRLQDDPGLISSAVDEFLRYDSPIQLTDRAVREDCEIGGVRIRKGQLVALVLAGANRDPKRFADPDRLDLGRTDNVHLAFGQGNHYCPGSQLAKLEAEVAIGTLLRRFPDFTGPSEPPAWRRSMIIRGPQSLPLDLHGSGASPRS